MVKDMFRMMFAEMFANNGFDHEIMLQRFQMGIAIVGAHTLNPFYSLHMMLFGG